MPLSAPQRIAEDRQTPRNLALWRALQPLRSVVQFMNTGAHPDDETSAMLAALTFRDGVNLSYACANRGEGGQNDIGPEVSEDLGTVRTAEMERSAEVLDMQLYWLSQSPEDSVFDFGFSKSGVETMEKWTRARTLARFVDIVRTEKPDIICPTFLDIPGQHGHHRAMTLAAHLMMDLAADPSFEGSSLPVWQVSKLYLPAWSGAGGAYDDEVPPPPATLTIHGKGEEEFSGWTWERIGQHSRWFHKTQGMGHWVSTGNERDWPLHLARSTVGADKTAITNNLAQTLADLPGDEPTRASLKQAQDAIATALDAFPDRTAVCKASKAAFEALAGIDASHHHAHKIERKRQQLARVLRLASGTDVRGWTDQDWVEPGQSIGLTVETREPDDKLAHAAGRLDVHIETDSGWNADHTGLVVAQDAAPSDPYPDAYDPLKPSLPALKVTLGDATSYVPLETTPLVQPKLTGSLSASSGIINLATHTRSFALSLLQASNGEPALALPEGWEQHWDKGNVQLDAPANLKPGLYTLPLTLDGAPAQTVRRFTYPHIAPRLRSFPAALNLRAVHVDIPSARVGYAGGGNDTVAHWLRALGCDVVELDTAQLAKPDALDGLDTILVGVFAIRFRDDLRARLPHIHQWVRGGGNLVTLYHRPWDLWNPDTTPPARLEIGQPSLRWRVTDENAVVTHLAPDHPLLTKPNVITLADWQGWHKERGLYFAKSWDAAYTPLLEMADRDEAPHKGALLSADIDKGRHTHCCLILHHQMEKLTPGAFRLMANLLSQR